MPTPLDIVLSAAQAHANILKRSTRPQAAGEARDILRALPAVEALADAANAATHRSRVPDLTQMLDV